MADVRTFITPIFAWAILGVFSISWVVMGYIWGKKSKTYEDYALGGRSIGLAFGAATVTATWVTGNTIMVAPQFALQLGVWGMLAYTTASFGLFIFAPISKHIRKLMPFGYTSGDFMRLRYGKRVWVLFIIFSLFYSITGLVGIGMAGGLLIESLAGVPYAYGMSIILFTCIAYTMFGGLYAVIGTDFLQTIIILSLILIIAFALFHQINLEQIYNDVKQNRPALLTIMFPAAIMALFNNLLYGIGEIFHSNIWWSRVFACRDGVSHKAYLLGGLLWLPVPISIGLIALATGALGINVPQPDMLTPLVAAHLLGKLGAIIIFVIIFCALASTLDSALAATADLITQDIYYKMFRPHSEARQLRAAATWITLSLGGLAWIFALIRPGSLAEVLFFSGAYVGSMIWPILTGLYWRQATEFGAFWGMIIGSVAGLTAYFTIGWYVGALVGSGVSMVCVLASTLVKPGDFQWQTLSQNG